VANETKINLNSDGESGRIDGLDFRSRTLHRQLADLDEPQRELVVRDVLDVGAEVLARASKHGDLQQLTSAVERLDTESQRIVAGTADQVQKNLDKAMVELAHSIQGENGPLATVLAKFDPAAQGNVIDIFRNLVADTAAKVTKESVKELAEATQDTVDKLNESVAALDRFAAVAAARAEEAQRGTAKGLDHEVTVEALLGEVLLLGDSLEDVSTVPGLDGTKKGDKVITPKGGLRIVTEDKCTAKMTVQKIRELLAVSMSNRGAALAMYIAEDESKVPGNQPIYFIDDDKVVVVAERTTLRLAYALYRAKAIELAAKAYSTDNDEIADVVAEISDHVDAIQDTVKRFRDMKTELTKSAKATAKVQDYVDEMARNLAVGVTGILAAIDSLVIDDEGQQAA